MLIAKKLRYLRHHTDNFVLKNEQLVVFRTKGCITYLVDGLDSDTYVMVMPFSQTKERLGSWMINQFESALNFFESEERKMPADEKGKLGTQTGIDL